jgi:hypothetical protein
MLRLRPLIRPANAVATARPTFAGTTSSTRATLRREVFVVRPSSSSTTKKPFEPPQIKLDPSKSQLHEKAAKAAQLHAELNALMDQQAKRRAEEIARPFGSGFVNFIKRSKSEIINIVAAFCCVLLAYQIASMRRGARKLLDKAEEREGTVSSLRSSLGAMVGTAFIDNLANKCADEVARQNAASSVSSSSGWLKRGGISTVTTTEEERIKAIIMPVIERELLAFVGDQYLSDKEKEEKNMQELQRMIGVPTKSSAEISVKEDTSTTTKKNGGGQLGGIEELIVEIQKGDKNQGDVGSTVVEGTQVKRRKYAGSI